jgi:hypothetical protein
VVHAANLVGSRCRRPQVDATLVPPGQYVNADFPVPSGAFPGHCRAYPGNWASLPDNAPLGRETLDVVMRAIEELPVTDYVDKALPPDEAALIEQHNWIQGGTG